MAKTSLGKAYVQIIPSADGITNSITNLMRGESENAGKSSGNLLGSNLVGMIKKAIIGAGIGKVLTDSIKLGGEYEQLVGGVETLFKGSSDTIINYANEAYKTAGISANEYMKQATSFSASLLQSLGGDSAKASEMTNLAITDMADNANKMGSSLESIQNAYQGFAKQNYTMLDNLKLGYGGTKTEMQRLLKDAQALTGVEYNIDNLSDVYQAIHIIQTEMGIAGTTALESASTLEGSFSTVKSAFANLLTAFANGDSNVGKIMANLVKSVIQWLKNLIPMVLNIATQIPKAIVEGISMAMADLDIGVEEIMLYMDDFFTNRMPEFISKGSEIIGNLISGIQQKLPDILRAAFMILGEFASGILSNLPAIIQKGGELLQSLVQGIIANMPAIAEGAVQVVLWFANALVQNMPTIMAKGIEMIGNLLAGIYGEIPNMFSQVKRAFAELDWMQIGKDLVQGIINGISKMGSALWNACTNIAKSAWKAVTDFFSIKSPSRKMMWAGNMVGEGLRIGLEDSADSIAAEMNSIAKRISSPIEASMNYRYNAEPTAKGYQQTIVVNAPTELSPSEVARQTKIATRNMVLAMNGGI